MKFRAAKIEDIEQLHVVRNAVTENALSNPDLISHGDYVSFLTVRGKGWVCEVAQEIVGFAIADLQDNNIWALFILPAFEGRGIGRRLQELMLTWYFTQGREEVWLGTAPASRAAEFYRKSGWRETGKNGSKEIRFEMTHEEWIKINSGVS